MDRRTFLSVLGAGAFAGCTGGNDAATPTATRTDTATATPTPTSTETQTPTPTPTPVAGEDIDPQQEYLSDEQGLLTGVLAARIFNWAYSADLRYYDDETDSLKEYSTGGTVFFSANISLQNLGGGPVERPSYESFSIRYNGDEYEPICSLPAGITFENLREDGNEYSINEPDCEFGSDNKDINPEEYDYVTILTVFPSPEQDFFLKWEPTRLNTGLEPTYFRFEVDDE